MGQAMKTFFVALKGEFDNYFVRIEAPDEAAVMRHVNANYPGIYKRIESEAYFYEVTRKKKLPPRVVNPKHPVHLQ